MGTIAQKLEYLNDTRLLLKDNINKINNVLTDESTFRSYPQELFNGYLDILNNGTDTLWNNLEKVSQTGTEAVLEGVETAPMKMVLNGNTSQDGEPTPDTPVEVKVVKGENVVSVSGKNLFDQSTKTDYPINLGDIELCKINTYKDYFHKDSGKWYVHKEIGKVVLDGTQTISSYNTSSTNTTRVSYHNLVTNMVGVVTLLCNMLPQKNNWNNDTEGISYNAQNRDIWFRISKSTIGTTQTETNSFLATNNMIIYYVLATPTEEEITNSTLIEQLEAISNAKSVKDKTYISQTNDDLPFILDVSAIKEYEVN